jgi:hypothetical protein
LEGDRFPAAFRAAGRARLALARFALDRLAPDRFAVGRFAADRLAPPARRAVFRPAAPPFIPREREDFFRADFFAFVAMLELLFRWKPGPSQQDSGTTAELALLGGSRGHTIMFNPIARP